MTNKLDQTEEAVILFNDVISKLRQEIDTKIKEMEDLHSIIEDKDKQVADLKEEVFSLNAKHKTTQDALYAEAMRYKSQLDDSNQSIAELKAMIKTKEDNWEAKQKTADELVSLQKKEIGMLTNRINVLKSKLDDAETANKRVLLKSLEASKKYDQLAKDLADTKKILEIKEKAYKEATEKVKSDFAGKAKQLIADNTKRVVAMMAQIEGLKNELKKRDIVINEKEIREQEILDDFVKRFKEVTSDKTKLAAAAKAENAVASSPGIPDFSRIPTITTHTIAAEPEPFKDLFDGLAVEMEEEEIEQQMAAPDMSLLQPMVERALEQGDAPEDVIDSLVSSGYPREEVVRMVDMFKTF